jgi:hypothetical protein
VKSTGRLAQLAVLAAAPVEAGASPVGIASRLAGNAGSCAGQGAAPRLGDFFTAFRAISGSFARRHIGPRALDRVSDRIVNLILYRTISRPTACHRKLPILPADEKLHVRINGQNAKRLPPQPHRLSAVLPQVMPAGKISPA